MKFKTKTSAYAFDEDLMKANGECSFSIQKNPFWNHSSWKRCVKLNPVKIHWKMPPEIRPKLFFVIERIFNINPYHILCTCIIYSTCFCALNFSGSCARWGSREFRDTSKGKAWQYDFSFYEIWSENIYCAS